MQRNTSGCLMNEDEFESAMWVTNIENVRRILGDSAASNMSEGVKYE